MFKSKIELNRLFLNRNIKCPEALGIFQSGEILVEGESVSVHVFLQVMVENSSNRFFIKLDVGKGGTGIIVIEREGTQFKCDGQIFSTRELVDLGRSGDFVVQEGILQRRDLADLNPSSVNTLRIITQIRNNEFRIPVAILRIGRNNSKVDNSAKGGISVNINPLNGILNQYGFVEHGTEVLERHPDSKMKFNGFRLENWEEIVEALERHARAIPELGEIAWDVAIGENGEVFIIN